MSSLKANSTCDFPENFSLEDCDALLKFPFHQYAIPKKEKPDPPDQGISSSPLFSRGVGSTTSGTEPGLRVSKTEPEVHIKTESVDESRILAKALEINRTFQRKMINAMNRIKNLLTGNRTKQEVMQEVVRKEEEVRKTLTDNPSNYVKPISLFAAPYFRDERGMNPPDNEDTKIKIKNCDPISYLGPPKPWVLDENRKLLEGVAANALSMVLKPYKTKRDYFKSKLKDKNTSESEIAVLRKDLTRVEKKIKKISGRPILEHIEAQKDHIDWMTISATSMQGSRSADECESMWNNYLHLLINKEPFTVDEDVQLRQLAKKYKGRNWDLIAESLGTKRTAIQCFERYQAHLNTTLTRSLWTKEEDERLLTVIDALKIGKYIPWNSVCSYMDGRTRQQIINRYDRSLCQDIKRTPWRSHEDAMLLACVKKYKCAWHKMRDFLPGRTSNACRERYVNTLHPDLKIGGWSKEEDLKLIQLIKDIGYGKWSSISRHMVGRTDNMCLIRARRLKMHSKPRRRKQRNDSDEDVDDPKVIAGFLKALAPTKACQVQNARLRNIQESAKSTLQNAIKYMEHQLPVKIDPDTLDFSEVSRTILFELKNVLYENEVKEDTAYERQYKPYSDKVRLQRLKRFQRTKGDKKSLLCSDDSSDVDDLLEELSGEEESNIDAKDSKWFHEVLESKFREAARVLPPRTKVNTHVVMSGREAAECSLYKSYLYQQFHCSALGTSDDEDVAYRNDYDHSLAQVVYHFVQPKVMENQVMVLAPNFTTLSGLETIEATEDRLQKMAKFVNHSKSYVQYLSNCTEEHPKCIKCSHKERNNPELLDSTLKLLKNELFVLDEVQKKAAICETMEYSEKEDICRCDELLKSKEAVERLNKRFLSLFLWPVLLSESPLSEEQEVLLSEKAAPHTKKKPAKVKRKSSKNDKLPEKKKRCLDKAHTTEECHTVNEAFECSESSPKPKKASKRPEIKPESPLRRSRRSCVLKRKSFAVADNDSDFTD